MIEYCWNPRKEAVFEILSIGERKIKDEF